MRGVARLRKVRFDFEIGFRIAAGCRAGAGLTGDPFFL